MPSALIDFDSSYPINDCTSFGILLCVPVRPSIDSFINAIRQHGALRFDRDHTVPMTAGSIDLEKLVQELESLDRRIQTVGEENIDLLMEAVNLEAKSKQKSYSDKEQSDALERAQKIYEALYEKGRLKNRPQQALFSSGWPTALILQLLGLEKPTHVPTKSERDAEIVKKIKKGLNENPKTTKEAMYAKLALEYDLSHAYVKEIFRESQNLTAKKKPSKVEVDSFGIFTQLSARKK